MEQIDFDNLKKTITTVKKQQRLKSISNNLTFASIIMLLIGLSNGSVLGMLKFYYELEIPKTFAQFVVLPMCWGSIVLSITSAFLSWKILKMGKED